MTPISIRYAALLSADTRAALDDDFGVEPLGSATLRGHEAPIEVYRLTPPGEAAP